MAAHGHGHGDGHAHSHTHTHSAKPGDQKALGWTLVLVVLVLVAELIGAAVSGSLALLSDAAHMFTDAAARAIALAATRLGQRGADHKRSFGYRRFEVLAALVNALMLLAAAAFIVVEAARRLFHPPDIGSSTMLWVAVLGLVVNLAGMALLAGRGEHSLNLKGAYLEVWSDMICSIGVIAGALVIRYTGWVWVDSIVAIGIGLWVLPRTVALLRESTHVLLEGAPPGLDLREVEQALTAQPGIASIHDLHVWTVGSGEVSLTAHAVVDPAADAGDALVGQVCELLAERFDIHHVTVQMERTPCALAAQGHGFGAPGG
jgi:cobalt-zinc-cadmium efflux system protein